MTTEQLEKANEMQKQIKDLVKMNEMAKAHECTYIQFTYGNGYSCPSVCNDPEIIEEVRILIIKRNNQKLNRLNSQFDRL